MRQHSRCGQDLGLSTVDPDPCGETGDAQRQSQKSSLLDTLLGCLESKKEDQHILEILPPREPLTPSTVRSHRAHEMMFLLVPIGEIAA